MIVVDASAVAQTLLADVGGGPEASARLASDPNQNAPALIDIEVISTIRRWLAHGKLTAARADQAVHDLADLPIVRYQHGALLPRIWELRHNVSPYDAAYVALAEALEATLVTADGRLANAPGARCTIEVLA